MSRRWMFALMPALWLAVLATAISVARTRHESRALFAELERLSVERDELNIEFNKLQLEQSTWSNHGFVERTASLQRRMYLPRPDEIKFVAP